MEEQINYIGPYRMKSDAFLCSTVTVNGASYRIPDAAGATADGRNVVRLMPNIAGNADLVNLVQDGDLLGYVRNPMRVAWPCAASPEGALQILKGRVSHAELGYAGQNGCPKQTSLWGAPGLITPRDCPLYDGFDNAAIGIYRVSLRGYGIEPSHEASLKTEVKRWKRIVRPVFFPCNTMDIDPVDFTTVEALCEIAAKCIRHAPTAATSPFDFKLNCVQWLTLVFSLAICFPLSKDTLSAIGCLDDYTRNWAGELGFADEGLTGLYELPIHFYTVEEAINNTLDLYFPTLKQQILGLIPHDAANALMAAKGIRPNQRVIMPAAFMMENRLRAMGVPRKTRSVFEYVATVVPENQLTRIGG